MNTRFYLYLNTSLHLVYESLIKEKKNNKMLPSCIKRTSSNAVFFNEPRSNTSHLQSMVSVTSLPLRLKVNARCKG